GCRWQPQNKTLLETELLQVGARQQIFAFAGRTASARNEPAQLPIATPVDRQGDEAQAALETELRADDELQRLTLGRHVGAHDSGDGALVSDGKGCITEHARLLDE